MTTAQVPGSLVARFRSPYVVAYRAIPCVLAAGFVIGGIVESVPALSILWGAVLLGVLAFSIIVPYRVELTPHSLVFISLGRRQTLLVANLESVELGWSQATRRRMPGGLKRSACRFNSRFGARFKLEAGKGIQDFLKDVAALRPDLGPQVAARWDRVEESRGRSGYQRVSVPPPAGPQPSGLQADLQPAVPPPPWGQPPGPQPDLQPSVPPPPWDQQPGSQTDLQPAVPPPPWAEPSRPQPPEPQPPGAERAGPPGAT